MLEVNILKEKIEQLSRGEFTYELPNILLSEEELFITVESGGTQDGNFTIYNSINSKIKGVLYSSSRFLCMDKKHFYGENNLIEFRVIAKELEAGRVIDAFIDIITDCGEIKLPVKIQVEEPSISSSIGKMKDLIQFANLAKSDWSEAKQLFKSEELPRLLNYYYKKNILVYNALRRSSGMSQAMDEFLVSVHKKVAVKFKVEKTNYEYEASLYSFMDKVVLTKEGWGYAKLRISTDAPFLEIERKIIWADNFIGDRYELNFVVKAEDMKDGVHHGNIYIETVHQTFIIRVKVVRKRERAEERIKERKNKQYCVLFVRNYIRFRFNQISAEEYERSAKKLLEEVRNQELYNAYFKLYQAHVELISGDECEALKLLNEVEESITIEDSQYPVISGVSTYLRTLVYKNNEDIVSATKAIRRIYEREEKSFLLLWCLLYIDKSYEFNLLKKYEDIKDQCMSGCMSPVLYYEAIYLMVEEPSLVKSLDSFELRVLAFALRNQYFSIDLARQITYLASKAKESNQLLFYILRKVYECYKLKETLIAICTLLIRNHNKDVNVNEWYYKGILEQLRITELPEYYMYSLSDENYEPFNHFILTYFNYNNKLPDKKKAYLYANIIKNKENDRTTYQNYERAIYEYALQKLANKSINKHLAVIYDDVFHRIEIDEMIAKNLPDVAFYYQVECFNPNIKSVAVVHKELKEETVVPFIEGKAFVEIFTDNANIFLLDENNERYHSTIDYTIYKLLYLNDVMLKCYEWDQENPKLLLFLAQNQSDYQRLDETTISLKHKLIESDIISDELKREYTKSLIYYYQDNFNADSEVFDLQHIKLETLDKETRKKVIEMMILSEMYEVVIEALNEFGYQDIDINLLMKFCSQWIHNESIEIQLVNIIVDICYFVFTSGTYDESIIKYLLHFYSGPTKDMHDLWRAAKNFDVDTIEIEERLLGQILFAECYIADAVPVFMSYYRNGFNHVLIRSFLSYYAYKYLVKDRLLEQELFDVMKRENGYERNDICLLALLKFYAGKDLLTDSEQNFVDYHMSTFEQNNMILPFFKDLKIMKRFSLRIHDKYFVEYRTDPNNKVFIHYLIDGNEDKQNFISEEMVNVCYGIFIKEFVLFENEILQYYISEESASGSSITESKSVNIEVMKDEIQETNFGRLNSIIHTKETMDGETFDMELDQYIRMEHAIDALFKPV